MTPADSLIVRQQAERNKSVVVNQKKYRLLSDQNNFGRKIIAFLGQYPKYV